MEAVLKPTLLQRVKSFFVPTKLGQTVVTVPLVGLKQLPTAPREQPMQDTAELPASTRNLATYGLNPYLTFVMEGFTVPKGEIQYRLRHLPSNRVIVVDEKLFQFLFTKKV